MHFTIEITVVVTKSQKSSASIITYHWDI